MRGRRPRPSRVRSTVGFTISLLGVAILLTGMLAYEAWQADRKHRETVHQVLNDYAQTTAWEFLHRLIYDLTLLPGAFGSIAGLHQNHQNVLPPLQSVIPTADTLARCSSPVAQSERYYFRLDLRDGGLALEGPQPSSPIQQTLADTIRHRLGTTPWQEWYIAPMFRVTPSGPRALVYVAVRDQEQIPIAAYGFETCNSALWEEVFRGVMRDTLLPPVLTGSMPNDSLLAVDATASGQFTGHYQTPVRYPDIYAGEAFDHESRGSVHIRVTLRPELAGQLVIGGLPRSRLPMLIFLLTLTSGVLAVAVRQLARERELLRLRADFTSSISHELRTPLAEILLFAETLELDRAKGEAGRREALQIIVQEARHLAHIVDNVLQFSRAERRMLRLRPERTVLATSIRDSTSSFTPLAASYGVNVSLELDDRIVVPVHPGSLHQVLLNLLDNAVKYGPAGQTIIIRATAHDSLARLEVDDEGPGIAPEDRERIWEPFIRLVPSSGGAAGSGIGLAVVRELIMAHRGQCWVEATPSGGARVVIELPGAILQDSAIAAGTWSVP